MIKGFKAIPLKGFSHYTVSKDGRVSSLKTGKILKPHLTSSGYHTVCLSAGSGNSKTVRVHRLVALTYIDKSNKKHNVVNHKDGDKTNNKLSNLEWTDAKGNSLMNEVYILEIYDPDDETGQSPILGVFNSKENAEVYRNEYIRDRYIIDEEDCSDQDLPHEIYPIEFNINRFRVMS